MPLPVGLITFAKVAGPVLASYIGGRASARSQKRFEERMSSTSYQRAVKDMLAAGLNPALAYSQGGASTPSAGIAQVPDVAAAGARQQELEQQRPLVASEIGLKDALAGEAAAGAEKHRQDVEASKTLQNLHRSETALRNTQNMIEMQRLPKERLSGGFWKTTEELFRGLGEELKGKRYGRGEYIFAPKLAPPATSGKSLKRMLEESQKERR